VLQIQNVPVPIYVDGGLASHFVKISRYTPDDMKRAVELVKDGYAVARAAEIAGVPRITLVDRQGFTLYFGIKLFPPPSPLHIPPFQLCGFGFFP
jgi:hypothetical protein